MKKKIIISITIFVLVFTALNIANAKAEDPCFDGMCSIEVNITTGKTTITRLSDAEIAIRLAAKAESDRLAAIAKAEADRLAAIEAANKPKPVVIETSTVITQPAPIVETKTATVATAQETKTAQSVVQTTTTVPTSSPTQTTSTNVVADTKTAVVETITATAVSIEPVMTISTLKAMTIELSDVIWAIKNQINYIRKEMARILIRTKGIK